MGGGSWTNDDYSSYSTRTAYKSAPIQEVFRNNRVVKALDPKLAKLRESCDSPDNPKSTPVILALDVTGSMGKYAMEIAKDSMPEVMGMIYETKPVSNPHVMVMGVCDVHAGSFAPFQVSQFEADIRILEQMREVVITRGGGGNRSESYDLPWYFAGNRTVTDSFNKRQQKGFLFTVGDEEAPYQNMSGAQLESVFGPGEYPASITPKQCLEAAKRLYHVFHIVIEQGDHCQHSLNRVRQSWTELLDTNVLFLKDSRDLSELIISTMKIVNGQDMNTVLTESKKTASLRYAFYNAIAAD